jgi:sodium transport system permease protein
VTRSAIVAVKEIRDHARDRRSLLSSAFMALMGPGVVMLVSMSDRVRGEQAAPVLVGMLSVFALVASFTGGIDIAMDATAGERERRSLLPLLLTPVRRSDVLLGKWMAVTAFGLAGLALNTIALVLVLAWAAPAELIARGSRLAAWIALGLVPLTVFGAAVDLLVAARCRTTKEAHTALRSVAFAPMIVGMFLIFFPARIGPAWLVPIIGQQLLVASPTLVLSLTRGAVLAVVTLAASAPVLWAASRVLDREDMLVA